MVRDVFRRGALSLTALVLGVPLSFAADLPDGVYRRAAGEPAPAIQSQDGDTLFLGPKQELEFRGGRLVSRSNSNDRFFLSLTVPYDPSLETDSYVVVIDSTAYRQSSAGSSPDRTSSLGFDISGEKTAKQLAGLFDIAVLYREHPGHALLVTFEPVQQEFDSGAEVPVLFRLQNVGSSSVAIRVGGHSRGGRDNQYRFVARGQGERELEDIGSPVSLGGPSGLEILQPGGSYQNTVDLDQWFSLDRSGLYEVFGSFLLEFEQPGESPSRTVWEDWASARFVVRTKERPDEGSVLPRAVQIGQPESVVRPFLADDCDSTEELHYTGEMAAPFTEQTQINCFGLEVLGRRRDVEFMFNDGPLGHVWIHIASEEIEEITRTLEAEFGPVVFSSDLDLVFEHGTVALRRDPPEVLVATADLIRALTGSEDESTPGD